MNRLVVRETVYRVPIALALTAILLAVAVGLFGLNGSSPTPAQASASSDATLYVLVLMGDRYSYSIVDPDSGTDSYSAQVRNFVSWMRVVPYENHSGASSIIKIDGVTDSDGTVSLAEGSNVITVEVTAEDGETTRTYTVTVERSADKSTDATLSSLSLSGIDFGTFSSETLSYTADVPNDVRWTRVLPSVNDLGASDVIKLGGVEDTDGLISLALGSNVITVEVTAEDGETTQTYSITINRAAPPASHGLLTIAGVAQWGETLTADTSGIRDEDGFDSASFTYQWIGADFHRSTDSEIVGATGSSYTLSTSDLFKYIRVRVSFTDDAGNDESRTSEETESVKRARPGPPRSLQVQPADTGELALSWNAPLTDGGSRITQYLVEWKLPSASWGPFDREKWDDFTGDTSTSYTITGLAAGTEYVVRVKAYTYSVGLGLPFAEATSTTVVQPTQEQAATQNNPATGAPTITGTAQVGQTLTADTSGIADEDGLDNATFSYQWLEDDVGGTILIPWTSNRASYTPNEYDVGKVLKVRVSFTDDEGNEESLTSDTTTAVVAAVPGEPRSVAVERGGTGELDVSWEEPSSNGGSSITGYTVQWKEASGSWDVAEDVSEATTTEASYTITGLSLGTEYAVRVIATNSAGDGPVSEEDTATADAETSQQQDASENTPATGAPAVSGTLEVGQTLTADTSDIADADGIDNATFSYQWIRSDGITDTDISGATESAYTPVADDADKTINVRVSFTDDAGNDESVTSAATTAVEAALTAELQGVPNSHSGSGTFTFRILFSEDVSVGFAALKEHSFQASNATIKRARRVDGRNDLRKFTIQPSSDAAVVMVLPVTGNCTTEGAICTSGGKRLSSRLEINVPGPAPTNTAATGAPTISGMAQVGETLTASTSGISDAEGLTSVSFSYQWIANDGTVDADIKGATASTYTPAGADVGKTIKFQVSFTDDGGNDETLTSEATAAVEARPNSPATGAPTISGTAQVGETLTAGTSGVVDDDGLDDATFSYQRLVDDTDIAGATGSSYILTDSSEGKAIRVRVSFTDDGGSDESLTSVATGVVEAAPTKNNPATGEPTITGTAQVGETLTASTSGIEDDDGLDDATFSYQWLADDAETGGATNSTYTLSDADEGKAIRVRVSFTDDAGNEEALTSAATAAVAAAPTPLTAEFLDTPGSHGGQAAFTFELRFSEEFSISYVTLRDHAFTVTGGEITGARRLEKPGNIRWEITVTPDGDAGVTVALPETTDCNAQGGICTGNRRMLSNRNEFTVGGPGG